MASIVQFIQANAVICTITVLTLSLAWTHYWTFRAKRELGHLLEDVSKSQVKMGLELRDLRRRISEAEHVTSNGRQQAFGQHDRRR